MELLGVSTTTTAAVVLIGETILAAILIIGIFLAARHKGTYHHWILLTVYLSDFLVLKPLMILKIYDGTYGSYPWPAPAGLFPHIIMAVITVVSGAAAIVLAFKYRVKKGNKMFMPPKGKIHRLVGAVFVVSWFVVYIVGIVVFYRLYV
jgi:uncharacterized membrane protein YozB (DUF420 family)